MNCCKRWKAAGRGRAVAGGGEPAGAGAGAGESPFAGDTAAADGRGAGGAAPFVGPAGANVDRLATAVADTKTYLDLHPPLLYLLRYRTQATLAALVFGWPCCRCGCWATCASRCCGCWGCRCFRGRVRCGEGRGSRALGAKTVARWLSSIAHVIVATRSASLRNRGRRGSGAGPRLCARVSPVAQHGQEGRVRRAGA